MTLTSVSYVENSSLYGLREDPPTPVISNQSSPVLPTTLSLDRLEALPPPIMNGGSSSYGSNCGSNYGSLPVGSKIENGGMNGSYSNGNSSNNKDNNGNDNNSNLRKPMFSCPDEEPIVVDRLKLSDHGSLSPFSVTAMADDGGGSSSSTRRDSIHAKPSEFKPSSSSLTTILNTDLMTSLLSCLRHGDFQFFFFLLRDLFSSVVSAQISQQSFRQVLGLQSSRVWESSSSTSMTSSKRTDHNTSGGHRRCRRRRRRQQQQPVKIVGLPNQGQTCFLNSVLQALASLEPFLAYLDGIDVYQEGLKMTRSFNMDAFGTEDDIDVEEALPTNTPSFSRQLLDLLHAINSVDDEWDDFDADNMVKAFQRDRVQNQRRRRRCDPKRLLKQIGENNSQFRLSSQAEQQDAQELLQALLGVVIEDGQFEHGGAAVASSIDSSSGTGDLSLDSEEDRLMTSVLASIESHLQYSDKGHNSDRAGADLVPSKSGLTLDGDDGTSLLSLSGFLSRVGEEQRFSTTEVYAESFVAIADSASIDSDLAETSRTIHFNGIEEEKKQEHFDYHHVPLVHMGREDGRQVPTQSPSHANNGTLRSPRSSLATSAQTLLRKVSSATPSPLSGWMGSTIRCCQCKHVRPIQNAPFLDVPLTPTSIPKYLENSSFGITKPPPPNSNRAPFCTLDQCLADFTKLRRVEEVECRSCTIQREITHLEEETMMLRGAVETTHSRILRQHKKADAGSSGVNDDCADVSFEETKHLRDDLVKAEQRLLQLKTMDPDEDEMVSLDTQRTDGGNNADLMLGIDEDHNVQMVRCDAQKCDFFTRTPAILCCHIQRRYFDPTVGRMEKCVQYVEFPQILDLSPYCAYNPKAAASWASGSSGMASINGNLKNDELKTTHGSSYSKGQMSYRLQSVIEHHGNAFGGHYISFRRDLTGSWFRISDATVTKVSWRDVQACQAYMLFYEAV